MISLLLAPHNDDETLFASYIMQRMRPMKVVIITDAYQHEIKFGKEYGIKTRREESTKACGILNTKVEFLGLPDDYISVDDIASKLQFIDAPGIVIAPALEGGNPQHDAVSKAAEVLFGNRILYYSTYTQQSLIPKGELAIYPNSEEKRFKELMLQYYPSQLKINPQHFEAIKDCPEYLNLCQVPHYA